MRVAFQLRLMLIAISKETWRMTLAIGAVALGLAAVMILMALGAGARSEVEGILSQVGVNVVTVAPERVQAVSNRGGAWYTSQKLRPADVHSIARNVAGVRIVTPEIEESLSVRYGPEELRTTVKGVHEQDFALVRNFRIASGRGFTQAEAAQSAPVAILGSFIVKQLNGGFSMLNETIWIRNAGAFRVIGQYHEKGLSDSGTNYDDLIVVPYETARSRLFGRDYLDRILLLPAPGQDVERIIADVRGVLRIDHGIADGGREDYVVLRPVTTDMAKRATNALLGGLAWFLTAITLMIGGAGVFAVSYLNVLDRRGEIGLRIALGAMRRDIIVLFLMESLLLSAIGCLVGFATGFLSIRLLALWTDWRMSIDALVIVVPALVAALLGIVCGVLPAYRASRLTPTEALRAS